MRAFVAILDGKRAQFQFRSTKKSFPAVNDEIAVREIDPLKCDEGWRPATGAEWIWCVVVSKEAFGQGTIYHLRKR